MSNRMPPWPDRRTQCNVVNVGYRSLATFPSGDQDAIEYVDDDDHAKTGGYAVSGSPLKALGNIDIYGAFPPDTILSAGAYEAGGAQSYDGTATYSLCDADGNAVQTVSLTGGGSSTSTIDTAVPQESPNYYSQSAYCGNLVTTLDNGPTQFNATQRHSVSGHDAEGNSPYYLGTISYAQFIALMSDGGGVYNQCPQKVSCFTMRP